MSSEGLITKEALLDAGAEMNRNKAVGVDGIPGTVVKEIEGCKITTVIVLNSVIN